MGKQPNAGGTARCASAWSDHVYNQGVRNAYCSCGRKRSPAAAAGAAHRRRRQQDVLGILVRADQPSGRRSKWTRNGRCALHCVIEERKGVCQTQRREGIASHFRPNSPILSTATSNSRSLLSGATDIFVVFSNQILVLHTLDERIGLSVG